MSRSMTTRNDAAENYHRWYYDSQVWTKTTYLGVPILKWVGDLWNYQEIIHRLRPQLIVDRGLTIRARKFIPGR